MTLVKRSVKGSPVSAAEYDAVVDQVETNKDSIEVLNGQFKDSQVTLSFANLAAATSYWNTQDGLSNTPTDGVLIYIEDVKEDYKWLASDANKAVATGRNFVETKTTFDKTDNVNNSTDKAVFDGVKSEITDEIDAKATEAKTKTDNIIPVIDNSFGVSDENGKLLFLAEPSGFGAKKFNIKDENGNIVGSIDLAFITNAINAALVTNNFNPIAKYLKDFILIDDNNKVAFKYDENGLDVAKLSEHFKSLLPTASASVSIESDFTGNYVMHLVYGQSLAVAGNTQTAEEFYTAKTFSTGVLINQSYADTTEANNEATQETRFAGITDLADTGNGLNGRYITKLINQLIVSENGKDLANFNHNQFAFVTGISGGQWYQFTKWNSARTTQFVDVQANTMPTALSFTGNGEGKAYLNLMQAIYFANKFAKAEGKKLVVGSLSYIQGEASADRDDTVTEFKAKLNALFDDITADVTTITGQTTPVKFITYQNASFALYNDSNRPEYDANAYTEGVPLAMVEITKDRADTFLGTPLYPYSPTVANSGDLIHLQDVGYALMSSLIGIVVKKVFNNNKTPKLLEPITANIETWQSGANWYTYIPFNVESKPLVFDVEGISGVNMRGHGLQPNYGFSILNGSSTEIITNVALSSDDAIVITTDENPTGLDLTYALTGAMGGGNLRDSQGDKITTEFNGTTYRCDNWCPFFRITL